MAIFDPVANDVPNPSFGSSQSIEFDTLDDELGNGYRTVIQSGLNNRRRTITLNWDFVNLVQANYITGFFDDHKGFMKFDYSFPPPRINEPAPPVKKFICKGYTVRSVIGGQSIRATIEEITQL